MDDIVSGKDEHHARVPRSWSRSHKYMIYCLTVIVTDTNTNTNAKNFI